VQFKEEEEETFERTALGRTAFLPITSLIVYVCNGILCDRFLYKYFLNMYYFILYLLLHISVFRVIKLAAHIPISYLFRLLKKSLEITENLQERHHPIPDVTVLSNVFCILIQLISDALN
jgi:hypothetical protein